MNEVLFSEARIRDALGRVAARLAVEDKVGEVLIYGGASMVLVFRARPATRDVDAVILSEHAAVERAVRDVGQEMALPRSWLNEQATAYLPRQKDPHPLVVFDHPNLRVMSVSAEYLLAMKMRAARGGRDLADIGTLARHLKVGNLPEALVVHDRLFPHDPLPLEKQLRIEDALQQD